MHSLEVVERFTSAKHFNPAHNEDVSIVSPTGDYVAVVDGSSLAKGECYNGMSGGRFAAVTVADAIVKLPPNIDAISAIAQISSHLSHALDTADRGTNAPATNGQHLAAAAAVIYSRQRGEIWCIGDCPFMVDGETYKTTLRIAEFRASARQYLIHQMLTIGVTEAELLKHDPTPTKIAKELMPDSRRFANSNDPLFGYGVLNGDAIPAQHIRVFNVSAAREIVLASDGYPQLRPTLKASEEYLAYVLAEDPLCYKTNPQPKGLVDDRGFDDRTYLRLRVGNAAPL